MQTIEQELDQLDRISPMSQSEPDHHLSPEEAEEIFRRAEAEIQPILRNLRKQSRHEFLYGLAELCCYCLILFALGGIVWQCITYPHTLVVLYTKAIPANITATLALPTRPLASVTLTRSATIQTTGTGYQKARAASGTLTFYNGNASQQTIGRGTVLTGSHGVQVRTDQTVTIPAANPPYLGQATITATTLQTGSRGNIQAFDINGIISESVFVKNLSAFTGGQEARTFRAVAPKDLHTVTAAVTDTLTRAFTTAFPLQKDEAAIPTNCHVTTSANHQVGEEAQSVTLTLAKTCSAVAYNQRDLTRAATAAFQRTQPGKQYHLVGRFQTTIQSVTPLTVTLSGKWAFTFSQSYQDYLAEQIQGESPAKAKATLLKTGVISYASVPNTLASADHIHFLVLVG